ncbi:MAG: diaminopimelate decarboxylase [Phycisphaerales bacterium]
MDLFSYRDGVLHAEDVPLPAIASAAGTPTYVYSAGTIREHYARLVEAFAELQPLVCYSIKSCGNLSICRLIGGLGGGMDVVSGGELARARAAGVAAEKCVYAGVGKTDAEIRDAIEAGIGLLNVESEAEFENIAAIAATMRRTVRCALRVNPDVDPQTHRYTSTGKKETKFGVDIERAKAFFDRYGRGEMARFARLVGIHLHIGSPVLTTQPYVDAVNKTLVLVDELARGGQRIEVLDLGGGFGADYESAQSPLAADYAAAIVPLLADRVRAGLRIVLEPGRTIVANAGILLLRVLYMKTSGDKSFAICDGGMNALLRPSHYNAFHFMWPVVPSAPFVPARRAKEMEMPGLVSMDVVGPICESGDFLALDRALPPLRRDDLLAVFTAGAYGMSMASRYNSSPLPAEVLVDGADFRVVRRRETHEDLVAHER